MGNHRTLIDGIGYNVIGGIAKVDGMAHRIKKGEVYVGLYKKTIPFNRSQTISSGKTTSVSYSILYYNTLAYSGSTTQEWSQNPQINPISGSPITEKWSHIEVSNANYISAQRLVYVAAPGYGVASTQPYVFFGPLDLRGMPIIRIKAEGDAVHYADGYPKVYGVSTSSSSERIMISISNNPPSTSGVTFVEESNGFALNWQANTNIEYICTSNPSKTAYLAISGSGNYGNLISSITISNY